jgi:hypothetical protein
VSHESTEGKLLTTSAKVSKGEILVYFNDVFDALSKVRSVQLAGWAHVSL